MKKLYIIRHAKAEEGVEIQADFERNLEERGINDAHKVGIFLQKQGIIPQKIYVSPAHRTRQTAEILAEKLNFNKSKIAYEKNLYDATHSDFLNVITSFDNQAEVVLLVGHNPSCTMVADYLTNANVSFMPTCAVACLEWKTDDWATASHNTATLLWLKSPKEL
ncbi:MAG: phosphohistidine phosphatase SixA [Bacteroidetes bacterium]|nr:MAG: phosphohistidine phosphatase SixA [Bacteroidota bacterium]TAG86921.1 MAG: phosphohistidine phosphatase SixA [Bacteroidota bacterium]